MSYIIGSLILGYTGFVIYKKVKDVKGRKIMLLGLLRMSLKRKMWDVI